MRFQMTPEVVLLALGITGHAYAAPPSENDARAYAEQFFASKLTTCTSPHMGLRHFVLLGGKTLTELSKPWLQVTSSDLSDADHLNRIDFTGEAQLRVKAYRMFSATAGGWDDWVSVDSTILAMGILSPFFNYVMLIEHKNGRWQTDRKMGTSQTFESLANLDCNLANSIKAKADD